MDFFGNGPQTKGIICVYMDIKRWGGNGLNWDVLENVGPGHYKLVTCQLGLNHDT